MSNAKSFSKTHIFTFLTGSMNEQTCPRSKASACRQFLHFYLHLLKSWFPFTAAYPKMPETASTPQSSDRWSTADRSTGIDFLYWYPRWCCFQMVWMFALERLVAVLLQGSLSGFPWSPTTYKLSHTGFRLETPCVTKTGKPMQVCSWVTQLRSRGMERWGGLTENVLTGSSLKLTASTESPAYRKQPIPETTRFPSGFHEQQSHLFKKKQCRCF